jgi:hypothetical protein
MIIWLNGPYGVGKSTTAEAIRQIRPDTFLLDAEQVGDAIRGNLPKQFWFDEFPEYPLWRRTVAAILVQLGSQFDGDVVVPMTVLRQEYLNEIFLELESHEIQYLHVLLTADMSEVHDRILCRGETESSWCMQQIIRCQQAIAQELVGRRVSTMGREPAEIAAEILGLTKPGAF